MNNIPLKIFVIPLAGVRDEGHASSSTEFCTAILDKFPFPQGMKDRIIDIVDKIPISETLKDVLFNNLQAKTGSSYVFINPKTKLPYTDIKKSFHSVMKEAKIDNFRFHDLRHTVATRLAESNIDLVVVKEILGHADIQTTMRYAHAVPKRKIEAISVLNSYN